MAIAAAFPVAAVRTHFWCLRLRGVMDSCQCALISAPFKVLSTVLIDDTKM